MFDQRCAPLLGPVLLCLAGSAAAHHSYAEFDNAQVIEIDGKLRQVSWRNPHATLEVEVADAAGSVVIWDIETLSRNYLVRTGISLESFVIGGPVKVAGWQSKRNPYRMYGTALLSADGSEVVWRSEPRWSRKAYSYGEESGEPSETSSIFRVWASVYGPIGPQAAQPELPLTESARRAVSEFDSERSATLGCQPKGMPIIMFQPTPIELIDRGDSIVIRIEEYDSVREIHMRPDRERESRPPSPGGYSTGRWDGKSLVVETDSVATPYLNARGVPLGAGARFVERFTPSDDGSRLDYRVEVTAPESLMRPVVQERFWGLTVGRARAAVRLRP